MLNSALLNGGFVKGFDEDLKTHMDEETPPPTPEFNCSTNEKKGENISNKMDYSTKQSLVLCSMRERGMCSM